MACGHVVVVSLHVLLLRQNKHTRKKNDAHQRLVVASPNTDPILVPRVAVYTFLGVFVCIKCW
jgi:hypothetical protein